MIHFLLLWFIDKTPAIKIDNPVKIGHPGEDWGPEPMQLKRSH
jgi:hypothetical protein